MSDDQADLGSVLARLPVSIASSVSKSGGKQTAKSAIEILLAKDIGFHEPSGVERRALLVAFAQAGKVLYGAAFDIVRSAVPVNYFDAEDVARHLDQITVYEIKSTNRRTIGPDFAGYFFALTTAELLVAQSLKSQFKFLFVNVATAIHAEMALKDVFSRARGIYPTWSIKF